MIKKYIKKFKFFVSDLNIKYPKEFRFYEQNFLINDWKVQNFEDRWSGDKTIGIFFKGVMVSETYSKLRSDPYNRFDGIVMKKGFEKLKPEVEVNR